MLGSLPPPRDTNRVFPIDGRGSVLLSGRPRGVVLAELFCPWAASNF